MIEINKKLTEGEKHTISQNNRYRINIAAVIEHNGLIFVGKRIKNVKKFDNNIQMPQGGLDENESLLEGIYREIYEETGISKENLTLVKFSKKVHCYKLPKVFGDLFNGRVGQAQIWFHFKIEYQDCVNINRTNKPEFSAFWFVKPAVLIHRCVNFKISIYKEIFQEFGLKIGFYGYIIYIIRKFFKIY